MTQNAQTTIPPQQHYGQRDWAIARWNNELYTNLAVSATVRLAAPCSRDSQGQETFLATSVDNQTCNYDTDCSIHHLSPISTNFKEIEP